MLSLNSLPIVDIHCCPQSLSATPGQRLSHQFLLSPLHLFRSYSTVLHEPDMQETQNPGRLAGQTTRVFKRGSRKSETPPASRNTASSCRTFAYLALPSHRFPPHLAQGTSDSYRKQAGWPVTRLGLGRQHSRLECSWRSL